ncbi:serine/threonine-protein kinase [Nonomuraea sediminis]|uniref:serine/threonine-protein kinase n=1 Tax=Nonomuraea sediminis TaxID=2835864 RepID=UPI001BDBC963|nr:serine/threonine-protein kinase [Nonomuraea sediminis]
MVTPLTPDDPVELGSYRLAGRLGEGGQGVVYLGFDAIGERVAVKLLSTGDPQTRARLARELSALESIASFCTARVLDAATQGQRPYVVSEFVDGPSLSDRVRERGPLRGGELERLAVGTATALAAIHAAGVVHRDFKPANVLLGPDGPRVVDFGIARAEDAATHTSGLIGTPTYLSPEQIGGSPATATSDVFAWGATIVYAATGASPFGADTVPAVLHRVLHFDPDLSALPPRLRAIIASTLSKDPTRRPTARDLMVSLVNPTTPPHQPPPDPHPFDGTHPRAIATTGLPRRRTLLFGTVAAALALAAGGATLWWANRSPATGTTTTTLSPAPKPSTSKPQDTEPSDHPTQAPQPNAKIPAAFAGTWKGTASGKILDREFNNDPVTLTLHAGKPTGTWESPGEDPGCSKGTLTLTRVTAAKLTFTLGGLGGSCSIIDEAGAIGGIVVTVAKKAPDTVAYSLTFSMLGDSKGDLNRAGS